MMSQKLMILLDAVASVLPISLDFCLKAPLICLYLICHKCKGNQITKLIKLLGCTIPTSCSTPYPVCPEAVLSTFWVVEGGQEIQGGRHRLGRMLMYKVRAVSMHGI